MPGSLNLFGILDYMKYEKLLEKMANDPEWAKRHRQRTLELQRKRYENPEVRRRHAIACDVWRERKARGLGRKKQAPHTPAVIPKFEDKSFCIVFE
jgi:hypothetical protein